jgi:hypothetical protein
MSSEGSKLGLRYIFELIEDIAMDNIVLDEFKVKKAKQSENQVSRNMTYDRNVDRDESKEEREMEYTCK